MTLRSTDWLRTRDVESRALSRVARPLSAARHLDSLELSLIARGEAFFHVSGAGHEASACFAPHLVDADFLHCHYRDKALLLARGVPPAAFFHALLCTADGASRGRQMSAHLCDPARNVLSIVGPVGNHALQAVGVAAEIKDRAQQPIVLCLMGDGTSQQGEVLEAIAEAVRWTLPVVFVVEDNGYSISSRTRGRTWYSLPDWGGESSEVRGQSSGVAVQGPHPSPPPAYRGRDSDDFYGLPIHRLDGRDVLACDQAVGPIIEHVRRNRSPALIVMEVERLCNHTNADDETVYRPADEIAHAKQTGDPLAILRKRLLESGTAEAELDAIEEQVRREVEAATEEAMRAPDPEPIMTAKRELAEKPTARASERRGMGVGPQLTMAAALRETLRQRMTADARVTLYGEDIEDPKGDFFGVTKGLTQAFGDRVRNSPVSESTIIGTSIGRALAGGRPVAFIQFADFLPLAFNQIATELGSMYWRTNGGWECPVIVMIACGGYRPGLGPFHAHTMESIAAHVPGVDVCMPSNATDAVGMLNAAFDSGRPTLFFYPKARLNDPKLGAAMDVANQFVPIGRSRIVRAGKDITLVGWGNTVQLCEQTADALRQADCLAEVINLRWISPWDQEQVIESANRTKRLLVVHEDNHTCGFGAEMIATVAEAIQGPLQLRRVARPDTYVPCHFGNQLEILPSFKRVLSSVAEMLGLKLSWDIEQEPSAGVVVVDAIGSSPVDESVTVVQLKVRVGDAVASGDVLAYLDCDKALFDLTAPASGVVEAIHVAVGQTVPVGKPLLTLRTGGASARSRQPVRERPGTPRLRKQPSRGSS